jgi:hypothetical protein
MDFRAGLDDLEKRKIHDPTGTRTPTPDRPARSYTDYAIPATRLTAKIRVNYNDDDDSVSHFRRMCDLLDDPSALASGPRKSQQGESLGMQLGKLLCSDICSFISHWRTLSQHRHCFS